MRSWLPPALALVVSSCAATPVPDPEPSSLPQPVEERKEPPREVKPVFPAWLLPAGAHYLRGDLEGAAKCVRDHLAGHGTDALAWNALGSIESDRGRFPEAVEAYTKARDLEPDSSQAWEELGGALGRADLHAQAVDAYRGALERDPANREALYGLGYSLNALGQYEEAIKAWKVLLDLNPSHRPARQGVRYAEAMLERGGTPNQ